MWILIFLLFLCGWCFVVLSGWVSDYEFCDIDKGLIGFIECLNFKGY